MKHLMTIIFVFFANVTLFASHITGGEITYESLGNNQYKIYLKVFRDCSPDINWGSSPYPFDYQSYITFFKGDNSHFPIGSLSHLKIDLDTILTAPNNHLDSCFLPTQGFCLDIGYYSGIVTLPYDSLGYHIVYQRCCRDNFINNLNQPGTLGMTLNTFISKEAQQLGNQSPGFNILPQIHLCTHSPLFLDLSLTDMDGDSLSYSLCEVKTGASIAQPQPYVASTPPYSNVTYPSPFSAQNPFGTSISIDSFTGILTGMTTSGGLFVVGVCIDEYRNGVWIGSIRRDFRLEIYFCTRTITADILKDSIDNNGHFIINAYDSVITLTNQSSYLQYINSYQWDFPLVDTTLSSTLLNPTFTFPGYGIYKGTLIVNPEPWSFCSDTAWITVHVMPPPVSASFLENDINISYFPNPVNDNLKIDLKNININDLNYSILNSLGQPITKKKVIQTPILNINMNNYSDGIYFIVLRQNSKVLKTLRILKQ